MRHPANKNRQIQDLKKEEERIASSAQRRLCFSVSDGSLSVKSQESMSSADLQSEATQGDRKSLHVVTLRLLLPWKLVQGKRAAPQPPAAKRTPPNAL